MLLDAHSRMVISAVNEVRRDWASGERGHMYACLVAEVNVVLQTGHVGTSTHSKVVFVSPELYVCSDRNLRKRCMPGPRCK